jgi:hypothetical protein
LTQFLYQVFGDEDFIYFYNSPIFQGLLNKFSSISMTTDAKDINEYLRMLVVTYFKEKCIRLDDEFQTKMATFVSERLNHTSEEMQYIHFLVLNEKISKLKSSSKPNSDNIDNIYSLIVKQGIDPRYGTGMSIFSFVLYLLDFVLERRCLPPEFRLSRNHLVDMFKPLIISYGYHLKYEVLDKYSRLREYRQLLELLGRFKHVRWSLSNSNHMKLCRILVDILIFSIECFKHSFEKNYWIESTLSSLMQGISLSELITHNNQFLETMQKEILKRILDDYAEKTKPISSTDAKHVFNSLVRHLIKNERFNEISFFYRYNESMKYFFDAPDNIRLILHRMLTSQPGRQCLDMLIDQNLLKPFVTNKKSIFFLLEKKEIRFIKKLFHIYPSLINILDEDGNDPLLYVSLKVDGRRYSLIRCLIEMGCNQQRHNVKGQTFIDALQLQINRRLLKALKSKEININV